MEIVEIDETVEVEDKRPDFDEELLDRKRKRKATSFGVDPFDDSVTMHFPAEASIIQEPKKYVKEVKRLVLKADKEYIGRMKMQQIQERTIAHLVEAILATVICDELCTVEANRAKAVRKENDKLRIEHGDKVKNQEEKVKSLKKKADEYDLLEAARSSLESSLAAAQKEIVDLKSEKAAVEFERYKLLESVKDAQMLSGLAMKDHRMKEFLRHGGADWDLEAKIKAITEYKKDKGLDMEEGKKENEEKEDKVESEDKESGEKMDEEASSPAEGGDGDQADA